MCACKTTPLPLSIFFFPGSLYLPHQLSDKESCCSLKLCGASSPIPVQPVVSDLLSPQVNHEPHRAAAHLSAACGYRSMTTALLTGRGERSHVWCMMTKNRTKNCIEFKSQRQIVKFACVLRALVLSLSLPFLPFLFFSPPPFLSWDHQSSFSSLGKRCLTLTSSLKSHAESSEAPLARELRRDERCVGGGNAARTWQDVTFSELFCQQVKM